LRDAGQRPTVAPIESRRPPLDRESRPPHTRPPEPLWCGLSRATDTGEYMYILVTAILAILITGIGGTLAYFCRLPELDETPNDPA